jgi:hypothetical protein
MSLYAVWWLYIVYWFASGSSIYPHSCGAANGALIIYSLFLTAIFSLLLIIQLIKSTKEHRLYYLALLGLVLIPPLLIFIYLYFG